MRLQKHWPKWLTIILLLTFSSAAAAQVVPVATVGPLAPLLPDTLGGLKATSDTKQFSRDNLQEVVGDKAAIYQEYRVISAASREYGAVRVDVFETQNQFASFGLFTFNTGSAKGSHVFEDLGSGGERL